MNSYGHIVPLENLVELLDRSIPRSLLSWNTLSRGCDVHGDDTHGVPRVVMLPPKPQGEVPYVTGTTSAYRSILGEVRGAGQGEGGCCSQGQGGRGGEGSEGEGGRGGQGGEGAPGQGGGREGPRGQD